MFASYRYTLDPSFKSLLASVGARHEDILRRARLPEDLLTRPDVRVTAEQFFAFVRAFEDAIGDPVLPVRLAQSAGAESFSPPVFAALCSPNLTEAITRLAAFKPLIAPIRLQVETTGTELRVTVDRLDGGIEPPPFLVVSEALFIVKLARMGSLREVRATSVTLPQLPRRLEEYEAFVGCRIRRGDPVSISFSAEDAQRPFITDNSAMWDIFEPQLRKRLADLEASASFEARTRAVLLEALPSGQISVDVVARRLAVGARTLQRRLRDEGTSFNAVVNETRKNLSLHYLRQTQLSYSEIAYLLGFKEPNSFFRAFQGWTGTTPEALRQSRAKGA